MAETAKRLALVLDERRCIACNTCSVACKVENNLPNDVWWTRVCNVGGPNPDSPEGVYPDLKMHSITMSCQHCENPACLSVCPVGATYKDEETGVVLVDYATCIGCQSCISACPYEGVRTYIDGEPSFALDFAVGDAAIQPHRGNVVEKCTFCFHRLQQGLQPACVDNCPARARYFGDLNDPESQVSKLLAEREYEQMLPEAGTGPAVYYLK